MSKVKITAKDGIVVIGNTNDDGSPRLSEKDGLQYGYIRLEGTSASFNNGFAELKKRSVLLRNTVEKLEELRSAMNLNEGTELPGKIVLIDSKEKSFETQKPKRAGKEDNAPVLTAEGAPIYMDSVYDPTGTLQDVKIAHDNIAEVKAFAAARAAVATSAEAGA